MDNPFAYGGQFSLVAQQPDYRGFSIRVVKSETDFKLTVNVYNSSNELVFSGGINNAVEGIIKGREVIDKEIIPKMQIESSGRAHASASVVLC